MPQDVCENPKKTKKLLRTISKFPNLSEKFVEIALQEQMYNKAKSKALENYRLTAGELESQAVEARDAFAQRLIGQGKSCSLLTLASGAI